MTRHEATILERALYKTRLGVGHPRLEWAMHARGLEDRTRMMGRNIDWAIQDMTRGPKTRLVA